MVWPLSSRGTSVAEDVGPFVHRHVGKQFGRDHGISVAIVQGHHELFQPEVGPIGPPGIGQRQGHGDNPRLTPVDGERHVGHGVEIQVQRGIENHMGGRTAGQRNTGLAAYRSDTFGTADRRHRALALTRKYPAEGSFSALGKVKGGRLWARDHVHGAITIDGHVTRSDVHHVLATHIPDGHGNDDIHFGSRMVEVEAKIRKKGRRGHEQ